MKSILSMMIVLIPFIANAGNWEDALNAFQTASAPVDMNEYIGGYSGRCVYPSQTVVNDAAMLVGAFETLESGRVPFGFNLNQLFEVAELGQVQLWDAIQKVTLGSRSHYRNVSLAKFLETRAERRDGSYNIHFRAPEVYFKTSMETQDRIMTDGGLISKMISTPDEGVAADRYICSWYKVVVPRSEVPVKYRN